MEELKVTEQKHRFNFAEDFIGYANIKVVGVGGGGGNAINRMIESELKGVEFIAVNTDAQVLDQNLADKKVQIGYDVTGGLGAGADPTVGRRAMEESRAEIAESLGKPNMVFITAGMGGGTGTGAAPLLAEAAKAAGALTVAIVTKPFRFEGRKRIQRAEEGLADLKSKVDTLITIPNERLLQIVDKKTTLTQAFAVADEVLHQATKGISDLITIPGLINCDFADVRTVMLEMGDALMGTGTARGEDRAIEASRQAISSPLLEDVSIGGARGILINVTGGEDMTLFDVNEATSLIYDEAGAEANIIFGAVVDPTMEDEMRVTVIATGLGEQEPVREKEEKQTTGANAGKTISMFPQEDRPAPQPQQSSAVQRQPDPEPMPIGYQSEHPERFGYPPRDEKSDDNGNGEGNGNGNGHGEKSPRNRVPMFSEDDPTIPAYLRRLNDRR
jgi:cell division protein FtsZ